MAHGVLLFSCARSMFAPAPGHPMSEEVEAPAEAEAPPKKGPKGAVLVGALVGTLLLGSAAGVFAIGPMIVKKSGYDVVPGAHGSAAGDSAAVGEDGAAGGEDGGKEGEVAGSALHLVDNLVLNPAGSGGARFLMLAAAVEFADSKLVDEMKTRDAEARDVILRVMGARTVDELSDMSIRERLKQELADSLGALFKKKKQIRRIYFPQFVIQ